MYGIPGSGASPKELIALCRVVARRSGVYATHMRSYSDKLVEAVEEQISIAQASECRLQISHLQAAGPDNWHLQQGALAVIEQAAGRGVDVAFDAYPWLAGCTVLTQVLPQAALDGGISQLLVRLADPIQRESIRPHIKGEARWNGVVITSARKQPGASLVGQINPGNRRRAGQSAGRCSDGHFAGTTRKREHRRTCSVDRQSSCAADPSLWRWSSPTEFIQVGVPIPPGCTEHSPCCWARWCGSADG